MAERVEGLGNVSDGSELPGGSRGLFPYDSVVGVLDDAGEVQQTVRELNAAGIPEEEIFVLSGERGVQAIDQRGERHGLLGRIFKALDTIGDEHEESQVHVDALRSGSYVVGAHVTDDGHKTTAAETFRRHHGRHVSFYGRWTTERLSP